MQVKLREPLRTRAMPERLRGVFTTSCTVYKYTFTFTFTFPKNKEIEVTTWKNTIRRDIERMDTVQKDVCLKVLEREYGKNGWTNVLVT